MPLGLFLFSIECIDSYAGHMKNFLPSGTKIFETYVMF